jgi:MEDS: MEthanogen/methylotroph, DcmR Sensory domain
MLPSTAYNEIVNVRREDAAPHARPADWSAAGECSHAVQFYESDGHLLDLLTRFVGTALVSGDVALVIATKAHRDGLNRRLKANGLDVSVPREQGRFIALDAAATLEKISRNGTIDAELFREILGELIDKARGGERRVVAFGEMVALLWAQGRGESAIQLEQYWNDLAARSRFSLCCAYPMQGFGNRHAASFMKICAQHSHVFTAARGARLPAIAASR